MRFPEGDKVGSETSFLGDTGGGYYAGAVVGALIGIGLPFASFIILPFASF
jgi:hypothetical protein